MNANKLADDLDCLKSEYLIWEWASQAQSTLRQQELKIESLENMVKYLDMFSYFDIPLQKEVTIEDIGLLTTHPMFSRVEAPLLLEFAMAVLKKTQQ